MKNKKTNILLMFTLIIALVIVIAVMEKEEIVTFEKEAVGMNNEMLHEKQDLENEILEVNSNQYNFALENSKEINRNVISENTNTENNNTDSLNNDNTKTDNVKTQQVNKKTTTSKSKTETKGETIDNKKTNKTTKTEKNISQLNKKDEEIKQNKNESNIEKKQNAENIENCIHDEKIWFNTYEDALANIDKVFNDWQAKYDAGEISKEELFHKCPIGYEIFRCKCGKYKVIFQYS